MMVQLVDQGEAKARKPHQCYDCYRPISPGQTYSFCKCVDMGRAYTVRSHTDCRAAALDYIADGYQPDYDDGIPPLSDMMGDSGEMQAEIDRMRGHFPHVATWLELNEQLAEIRWQERLRNRSR